MRIAFIVALVLATGCKDKTGPAVTPGSGSGSGSAVGSGSGSGSGSGQQALALPKLSGKAPVATKTKHTKAEYEKLSKLAFEDWELDVRRVLDTVFEVKHTSKIRPKIAVRVTISPCLKCMPMDLEKWRAEKEALRAVEVIAELRDKPDTTFELGEVALGGSKVMTTYQLGASFSKDDNGPTGTFVNAMAFFYNDGVNQVKLVTSYVDDPRTTKQELAQLVPHEHLEKIGLAFLDQYLQAWGN